MTIQPHQQNELKIAEVLSEEVILQTADDGLNLLGDLYYQGFDAIILHQQSITPDFFELKNGLAGEVLQKFSNYRMRLAIVGDFSTYTSKSIQDFIHESNKARQVNFVSSTAEALARLSNG
ncbi:DUF4180 domain-containing protein [Rhabdobacter roseus]|uniref:DUF4180 domain-containing protein n=1 Tax=Rhabdobacter roseus TaxID=1655419 RepID=A0A840U291_9BACT|nr:DUF4180 domain-containing protein [Rhabdobacter roseus]MBB5286250.1 hypothetical protein [Rhabdobacter roseus]